MAKLDTLKPSTGVTLTYCWDETDGYHFDKDGTKVAKPKATDAGDTLIVDSSVGYVPDGYPAQWLMYDATVAPTLDGKKGLDTVVFAADDGYIDDGFFSRLRSFEIVQLADDDHDDAGVNMFGSSAGGSAIFLGDYAFAAGVREVRGGTGDDMLVVGDLSGGVGQPSAFDAVSLRMSGGAGHDWLLGAGGPDFLDSGIGDDILYGGGGADVIHGGPGSETLYYLLPMDLGPVQGVEIDAMAGTGTVIGCIDALMDFQCLDDQIIFEDESYALYGDLLAQPSLVTFAGDIQLSSASGAFEAFTLGLSGTDTMVWFDTGLLDADGVAYPPLFVAFKDTVFWEVRVQDAELNYMHLSVFPTSNAPTAGPLESTAVNDIAWITTSLAHAVDGLDVYDATYAPAMDGGSGTDAIAMRGDLASISDDFFLHVTNFEGLKLADTPNLQTIGSAVTLGAEALEAGLTQVAGTVGDDLIQFGTAYDGTGVKAEGRDGMDEIVGAGGDDWLDGGSGDDVIVGGAGQDTLRGGDGNDDVAGGEGPDVFVLADGEGALANGGTDADGDGLGNGDTILFGWGIELIRGFTDGQDLLRLDEDPAELAACSVFDADASNVHYGIGDDQFIALRGTYDAATSLFTVDLEAGTDLVLAYDSESQNGSIDIEFVLLVGVGGSVALDITDFCGP